MSSSTTAPDTVNNNGSSYADEKAPHHLPTSTEDRRPSVVVGKSPGVARVEAISSVLTTWDRVFLFLGVFLVSYAYGLDGTLRYAYQPQATNDFGVHSLLATVNVLRAVIASAAQPTAAKIADVFGRAELIMVSVFFYVIGTIVEAVADNVDTFSAGACIYQIGYTMIIVLVEVIIADVTSTRSRLFFSYIPATPFIINTWVSGDITQAVIDNTTWKWGIGMWCIIYPVCAAPLITSLLIVGRRARKQGLLEAYKTDLQLQGSRNLAASLFWQLDVVGVILLIAVLALLLTPLTIAGGFSQQWRQAHVIAPLVVGFVTLPVFFVYEYKFARHPLLPLRRMTDRSIWGPMGIALLLNFAWGMQADYLYSVLIVAFDFSVAGATRVTSLYSFTSVIVGTLLGLVVYKVRRLKPFIVFGVCIYMVAFGLMIHYRGGDANKAGVIGAQVLLGFAGGMFPYPAQASLQVQVKHEHLAIMTGLYLALYQVGSAFGYTVSGAMWTQILPGELEQRLAFQDNATLAAAAYASPLTLILDYPMGDPVREAIVEAYQHIQRLLCIAGIGLCVPLLGFALVIRNPKLNDKQTLVEDSQSERSIDSAAQAKEDGGINGGQQGLGGEKWWQRLMR